MRLPIPYPGGLLLQAPEGGSTPLPYSGQVLIKTADADFAFIGQRARQSATDKTRVSVEGTSDAPHHVGILLGTYANGVVDTNRVPLAGEEAVVATAPCIVPVYLAAAVSAGDVLRPWTGGALRPWTSGSNIYGVALEAGSAGGTALAHIVWRRIAVT